MLEPAGNQLKVFICYTREDHAFACELFQQLKANGVSPWMDRPPEAFHLEGILPGQDWPLQIEQRVGEADCVLLILSPASVAQQSFVQSEFRLALHAAARKPGQPRVVALMRQAMDVPAFTADGLTLNDLDWIDYSQGGMPTLLAAIGRHRVSSNVLAVGPHSASADAITDPRIRWRAFAGRMHWRNNFCAADDALYLSSCGTRWNQDDRGDGVYCLEAETGIMRWTFNTAGDGNEFLLHGDEIIVGTDAGQLVVLDKTTGGLKKDYKAWDAIFARPFLLRAGAETRVFAISHKGTVLMVETGSGLIKQVAALPFPVRANAAVLENRQSAILFGETGEIARVWSGATAPFEWELLAKKTYFNPSAHSARRNAELAAAPVLNGATVIGGVVRDTYYSSPPLFRFDVERRQFLWGETAEEQRRKEFAFGNLRSAPLLLADTVIFAPAYAAALFAVDNKSGEIVWKIPVGQELFQQWSSPIAVDGRRVLLARADGILYQIDISARKVEWALSLLVTPSEIKATNRAGKLGPGPSEAAHNGVTATPLWDKGRIFLGTTEGTLFCIENA